MNWRKVWTVAKTTLGILSDAQDKGLVQIKELPKIKQGVGIIEDRVARRKAEASDQPEKPVKPRVVRKYGKQVQ